MRPYTRSLDPSDYEFLQRWSGPLYAYQAELARRGVPHREWHPHRFWEYASILQQLEELAVPTSAELIDVGSGGCFFAPYLATIAGYTKLELTDSMKYGDIRYLLDAQRMYSGAEMRLYDLLCEDMTPLPSNKYDVTMCISTIEHVDEDKHDDAFRELVRITKPNGYIFITSDYFRDWMQFEQSISRHLQFTPYTKEFVQGLPVFFPVAFVGDTDLDYRGDFVHNYSFCNIALRKVA